MHGVWARIVLSNLEIFNIFYSFSVMNKYKKTCLVYTVLSVANSFTGNGRPMLSMPTFVLLQNSPLIIFDKLNTP